MTRPIGPLEPKGHSEKEKSDIIQESDKAAQKRSEGGHLKERSIFDWLVYIVSFQWLSALFTKKSEVPVEPAIKKEPVEFVAEKREGRLHLTNSQTKATRTLDVDQSEAAQQTAIEDLSGTLPFIEGNLSDEQIKEEWIKKGNIYQLKYGDSSYLSLCPRVIDIYRAGFVDRSPIKDMQRMLKLTQEKQAQQTGTIVMPLVEYNQLNRIDVVVALKEGVYTVTLTYKNILTQKEKTYHYNYQRVPDPTTIEKDLLLARSYFVKELF
jgi:hypothetical protein